MFSSKLGRAAHRASSACPTTLSTNASTAPQALASASTRHSHQRRPSSSKASDSTTGGKPAPATRAESARAESDGTSATSRRTLSQKSSKGRSKSTGFKRLHAQHANKLVAQPEDQFAGLPSVPNLRNLNALNLGLSLFFSLHRPLSLTTPAPPPTSPEAFEAIFSRPKQDVWENGNTSEGRPEDIIITLQHTIDSLEGSREQEESDGVRWQVVFQGENGVKHLDGAPKPKSLDELVAQFKPFHQPPPPVPFQEEGEQQQARQTKKARKARQSRARSSGEQAVSTSPITEVLEPQTDLASIREPTPMRQTYLERIRRRRQAYLSKQLAHPQALRAMIARGSVPLPSIRPARIRGQTVGKMQLISVKRQRKLKMKKHKYKKLMKKTRNLRRRLDRN